MSNTTLFFVEKLEKYTDTPSTLALCILPRKKKYIVEWQMLVLIAEWSYFSSGLYSGILLYLLLSC